MFNLNICTNRVLRIQHTEQNENMEPQEGDENFTNFSITEILKPDFGRKHLTTEVLNLSRDRNSCDCEPNEKPTTYFSWGSHPLHQFGLRFGAFTSPVSASKTLSNIPLSTNNITPNKCLGLNLEVRNSSEKQKDSVETYKNTTDSYCGSDGESSLKSSPATSPSRSPGSSPDSGKDQTSGAGKLWPAWVYCTRYSDRPSAGRKSMTLICTSLLSKRWKHNT